MFLHLCDDYRAMVPQNRLDYGFNGYQVPPIPRSTRSARRRGTLRNRVDDNQMCAFDLLASVAGDLLIERSPPSSCDTSTVKEDGANVKIEKSVDNTPLEVEPSYLGKCDKKFLVTELPFAVHDQDCSLKEYFSLNEGCSAGFAPELMISYTTMNTSTSVTAENLANDKTNGMRNFVGEADVGSPRYTKLCGHSLDSGNKIIVKDESEKVLSGAEFETCRLKDPVVCDWKPRTLVGSENGFKAPSRKGHGPRCPRPTSRADAKVVGRDNDDKSFRCTHPTTSRNSLRTAPHIGGQRIRKILASKNWKVAAKYGADRANIAGYTSQIYFNKRNAYKNQRSEMNVPFKKRKLFDGCLSNCNGGRIIEEISESTKKGTKRVSSARGKSTLIEGHQGDSRVKLRIKSFRVPELFIEIPETATVSSLKRTVMEAVTTIIGHGIHVGVLIQGKKVRDDNKTLFQTGISHDNQDDYLGFTLEPHSTQNPSSVCNVDLPSMFPCSSTPEPITRCHSNPTVDYPGSNDTSLLETRAANSSNLIGSDHEPVSALANMPVQKNSTDSKALVAVPAMTMEALAVVPVCPKPKRLEVGQRRMRRPFSVAEVEALVHAVETLGTGRWRDVKLQAFNNANHRTYVDLKDKWKTLVHTARISPQQRRGEPVPQELLDRVLTAHAYWSQQQIKQQHLKHQPDTCLLLP